MGYTLTIGNAELGRGDWDYLAFVPSMVMDDAPHAPNDANPGANYRWPSYSSWLAFCDEVGLRDLFYDEETGLLRPHPGCKILTPEIQEVISTALDRYRRNHPDAVARFDAPSGRGIVADLTEPPQYPPSDYALARLEWLDWWVRWAIANCEHPAIHNT
jgi:hypothetical protein